MCTATSCIQIYLIHRGCSTHKTEVRHSSHVSVQSSDPLYKCSVFHPSTTIGALEAGMYIQVHMYLRHAVYTKHSHCVSIIVAVMQLMVHVSNVDYDEQVNGSTAALSSFSVLWVVDALNRRTHPPRYVHGCGICVHNGMCMYMYMYYNVCHTVPQSAIETAQTAHTIYIFAHIHVIHVHVHGPSGRWQMYVTKYHSL